MDTDNHDYFKTILIGSFVAIIIYWLIIYDDSSPQTDTDAEADPDTQEEFITYNPPKYCDNCGDLGRYDCNDCVNCGYCYTPDGYGECVPGDINGPFFRKDCTAYEYNANDYWIDDYPYIYLQDYPYLYRDGYYYDSYGYPTTSYST